MGLASCMMGHGTWDLNPITFGFDTLAKNLINNKFKSRSQEPEYP